MSAEECGPLKTLDDVLTWEHDSDGWFQYVHRISERSVFCYSSNDLNNMKLTNPPRMYRSSVPKTLVCHDMMGGYLNDRFVTGTTKNKEEYVFYNWAALDIFIYFSHYFITIPPLMWINAAHKHGVKILGTIITEGSVGSKICEEIFNSAEMVLRFTRKLIELCAHYNFDGYLLNIENDIKLCQIDNLILFLKLMKHDEKLYLIWYDSVSLTNGKLLWQNELNEHNEKAFRLCDGVFLNYNWNETNLKNSSNRAGARMCDVFVGIDVFGRGCFGGGGFNCDKAACIARLYGLSLALFGIGWTFEVQTMASKNIFFEVEQKFWSILCRYLYVSGPTTLPFNTSFCPGYGEQLFKFGKLVTEDSWFNLSYQCYQCSLIANYDEDGCKESTLCVRTYKDDGYLGGGCLYLKNEGLYSVTYTILVCDFKCNKDILFTVSNKWISTYSSFKIILTVIRHDSHENIILKVCKPYIPTCDNIVEDYSFCGYAKTGIFEMADNEWCTTKFNLLKIEGNIVRISIKTSVDLLIGYIALDFKPMEETFEESKRFKIGET